MLTFCVADHNWETLANLLLINSWMATAKPMPVSLLALPLFTNQINIPLTRQTGLYLPLIFHNKTYTYSLLFIHRLQFICSANNATTKFLSQNQATSTLCTKIFLSHIIEDSFLNRDGLQI